MSDEHPGDAFLAGPGPGGGGEADVVSGRYRLPDPVTGEVRSWTRASNVGAAVADRWALERWRLRTLLWGVGLRDDVVQLLRAMTERDDAKLDELITTALEAARHTEAANRGSTIHEVQRRVDQGADVPEGLEAFAGPYSEALAAHGLTVVAREFRVINRALGAAGRADVLLREADGGLVLGDTKSTGHLHLAAPEIGPQLACYATAEWAEPHGDGGGWAPMPPVRRDYAVVLHVDRQTGAVAPYRLDLFLGAFGANLATQVREYRGMGRAMLTAYVPPVGELAQGGRIGEVVRTAEAATGGRHLAAVPDPAPAPPAAPAPPVAPAAGAPLRTVLQLTKMTKAQVQQYLRDHGHGEDLAHQKGILVDRAKALGLVSTAAEPARSDDPAVISGPVNGSDPTDPRDPAFVDTVLRWVASAGTVAELGAVNQRVRRLGGDQAWTDRMAEAARARANALDAANPNHAALSRVVACGSQADLAALWDELTVGGSRPEGWPAEVDSAARERMRQIEAQAPPAPANPFGATAPGAS